MPIYAYRCASCGHSRDVLQKMSDPVLTTCPACGADQFQKQVTAAGFQLKGSGWYATDFKGGNAPRRRGRRAGAPPARGAGRATPAAAPRPRPTAAHQRLGVVLRRRTAAAAAPATDDPPPHARHHGRVRARREPFLRKYLFAGLLVWLPLAITVGVLMWAIGLMDGLFHGVLVGSSTCCPTRRRELHRAAGRACRAWASCCWCCCC